MPSSKSGSIEEKAERRTEGYDNFDDDPDAEFGGREERKALEKKLLRKLDLRMSILVVIYILNYVSSVNLVSFLFNDCALQIDRNNAGCVEPLSAIL